MEKPRVLIVDDNEATCTLITALLHHDFEVETAHDGMDAIAKLRSRQYAVILLDLVMPMADGYAVLDALRNERPDLLARVLVITASLTPREMQRVHNYPVCKVIPKPFEVDALLADVKGCAGADDAGDLRGLITTGMILLLTDWLM